MGKLTNDKQERFAQALAVNTPLLSAYLEAGFEGGEYAAKNASKLKNKKKVLSRIEELCKSTEDLVELRRVMLDEFYVSALKTDRASMYDGDGALKPLDDLLPEQRVLIESVVETKGKFGETHNAVMPSKLMAAAQLAKLHGLDRPTKIAPTNPAGDGPPEIVTDELRIKAIENLLIKNGISPQA